MKNARSTQCTLVFRRLARFPLLLQRPFGFGPRSSRHARYDAVRPYLTGGLQATSIPIERDSRRVRCNQRSRQAISIFFKLINRSICPKRPPLPKGRAFALLAVNDWGFQPIVTDRVIGAKSREFRRSNHATWKGHSIRSARASILPLIIEIPWPTRSPISNASLPSHHGHHLGVEERSFVLASVPYGGATLDDHPAPTVRAKVEGKTGA